MRGLGRLPPRHVRSPFREDGRRATDRDALLDKFTKDALIDAKQPLQRSRCDLVVHGASLTSGRGRKREKAAACAATLALRKAIADGYYPIGLTNSDNGDDTSGGDCSSDGDGDTGRSGRGSNMHADVHADVHAYNVHSRPAPCPRTMTRLCLGIDEAI